jgi:hypothetical protein
VKTGAAVVMQGGRLLVAAVAMGMLSCSSDGGPTTPMAVHPDQVEVLALPREGGAPAVHQLIDQAEQYYRLYLESGSSTWYDRHWTAAEGARLLLDQVPALDVEDLVDMPTGVEDDDLLAIPMGRA